MSYTKEFHATRHADTLYAARRVCSILKEIVPTINSAIDVGCGVGTWLSVLQELGVKDILGIDGNWVDRNMLVIPRENFLETDLTVATKLPRRFDLAICLEVAEHLPPERAKALIRWLTELSDLVLFSAAIPFQGGVNHVNEAWQSYWVELLRQHNYKVYDLIRPLIWSDDRINFWYRQNILVFAGARLSDKLPTGKDDQIMVDVVHPELFLSKCHQQTPPSILRRLVRAVRRHCSLE